MIIGHIDINLSFIDMGSVPRVIMLKVYLYCINKCFGHFWQYESMGSEWGSKFSSKIFKKIQENPRSLNNFKLPVKENIFIL